MNDLLRIFVGNVFAFGSRQLHYRQKNMQHVHLININRSMIRQQTTRESYLKIKCLWWNKSETKER